jgi:hypothetical protein
MPLPAKAMFYDAEIAASLDELASKVAENEDLLNLVARLKFMVKIRSEALKKWLTESGPS